METEKACQEQEESEAALVTCEKAVNIGYRITIKDWKVFQI